MRVLILDTCYGAFLDSHYGSDPGLADASYAEQWRALMDTHFATADAYSHNLATIGIAAHEIVVDAADLQRAWAREHDVELGGDALVLEQVRWFQPDVVYLQNLNILDDATLTRVRADGKLLVGQIASAAPPRRSTPAFDLVLTSFPHYVERFRSLGVGSEYFRIGFDRRILAALDRAPPTARAWSSSARSTGCTTAAGNSTFNRAARKVPIEFWGYDLRGGRHGLDPAWVPRPGLGARDVSARCRDARISLTVTSPRRRAMRTT